MGGQFSSHHSHRVREGDFVGIARRGAQHKRTHGPMGEHQSVKLLFDQMGGFAAQHDPTAAQVGL
jgi:hypothetical protein